MIKRIALSGLVFLVTVPQREIFAQEDTLRAIHLLQLSDGGVIQHKQYDGVLRRIDSAGRQIAQTKVPKAGIVPTTVVLSKRETRLLFVSHDEGGEFRQQHRVIVQGTAGVIEI